MLFTSSRGPLIASDNYFEWTAFLGTSFIFGLGEMELKPGDKKLLLNSENTHSIPYIFAFNNVTNDFHGLLFSSPGPVEVEVYQSGAVGFRALYSHNFYVEILTGPTLIDLIKQITMGQPLYIPPYWGHGIHVCR